MADATIVPGAQGGIALGKMFAMQIKYGPPEFRSKVLAPFLQDLYGTAWIQKDHERGLMQASPAVLAQALMQMPAGVLPRQGTSLAFPLQIPDLIGVTQPESTADRLPG